MSRGKTRMPPQPNGSRSTLDVRRHVSEVVIHKVRIRIMAVTRGMIDGHPMIDKAVALPTAIHQAKDDDENSRRAPAGRNCEVKPYLRRSRLNRLSWSSSVTAIIELRESSTAVLSRVETSLTNISSSPYLRLSDLENPLLRKKTARR